MWVWVSDGMLHACDVCGSGPLHQLCSKPPLSCLFLLIALHMRQCPPLQVIDHMNANNTKPVTRTYNTLMIACNTSGQWQEALSVYGEMVRMGHTPNTTTYNALISAHSKAGRLEKVRLLLISQYDTVSLLTIHQCAKCWKDALHQRW
jgi:pentatricopeptide repeat protein